MVHSSFIKKANAERASYYRNEIVCRHTLTASQILQSDSSIKAVMVADGYGGTQDLAFPSDSLQYQTANRLVDLLRVLALQARTMMDFAEFGKLRIVRTSFDQFNAFGFPLVGNRVLVLAVDRKNALNGRVSRMFEFLKSFDSESPIDDNEIVKEILSEITFSNAKKIDIFPSAREVSQGQYDLLQNTTEKIRKRARIVRSQNEIIIAILEACRAPSVQHWIMIKARLGYETFWTHMNRLLDENMLKCSSEGKKAVYSVTEAGLNLLEKLVASGSVSKFAQ